MFLVVVVLYIYTKIEGESETNFWEKDYKENKVVAVYFSQQHDSLILIGSAAQWN